jgi:hypothetical protein
MRRSCRAKAAAWTFGLALAGTVVSPAIAAPIASESQPTSVSAFGGRVVWSSYDKAARVYRLMTSIQGETKRVPVRPRRVPFDVDLGPDGHGSVSAVYSRCRRDLPGFNPDTLANDYGQSTACDLYRFDFSRSRERKLDAVSDPGASEYQPSIWGHYIAFVRGPNSPSRPFKPPVVYRARLGRPTRSARVGQGSAGLLNAEAPPELTDLELRRRDILFTWRLTPPTGSRCARNRGKIEPSQSEVWLARSEGRPKRIDTVCGSGDSPYFFSPGFLLGTPLYYESTEESDRKLAKAGDATFTRREKPVTGDLISVAVDGDSAYVVEVVLDPDVGARYELSIRPAHDLRPDA